MKTALLAAVLLVLPAAASAAEPWAPAAPAPSGEAPPTLTAGGPRRSTAAWIAHGANLVASVVLAGHYIDSALFYDQSRANLSPGAFIEWQSDANKRLSLPFALLQPIA